MCVFQSVLTANWVRARADELGIKAIKVCDRRMKYPERRSHWRKVRRRTRREEASALSLSLQSPRAKRRNNCIYLLIYQFPRTNCASILYTHSLQEVSLPLEYIIKLAAAATALWNYFFISSPRHAQKTEWKYARE